MTSDSSRVIIVGAGPVGLVAATVLAQRQIPVTVLEASPDLNFESRASTFHPPTLDMLDEIGAAQDLRAQGLVAPTLQYRTKSDGLIASFDFGLLSSVTKHPFRLQCEQFKLTRILASKLQGAPNFELRFGARVEDVTKDADGVTAVVRVNGRVEKVAGRWLIGADGARSATRKALNIEFEGFTWPERFLVVTTPFDFYQVIPSLTSVSYVADPEQWHFLLEIPGAWRVMFPVRPETPDDVALSPDYAQRQMATVVPGIDRYKVEHTTLYGVHQRVARAYRVGKVFIAGDAAHINNPLGGMGMNGGIHDAVQLCTALAQVWHDQADDSELDRYERQRRGITVDFVQRQTIQNKANLEARDAADHEAFKQRMRDIAADPKKSFDYLLNVSMINSLRQARELA